MLVSKLELDILVLIENVTNFKENNPSYIETKTSEFIKF